MRVVMFSRYPRLDREPRGGVETATIGLVDALRATSSVEVHVVTLERGLRSLSIENRSGVTVHRLPGSACPQIIDILAGPDRRRLKRYLRELAPDIVHFHETHGLGIHPLHIPHVFTLHGFDHANIPAERRAFSRLRARLWRWVEYWGIRRHRNVISISPYVRRQIEPVTSAAIHDINNPVPPAFFDILRRETPGRIFFAGWISHRKNPIAVVRAVSALRERGLACHANLAGAAPDAAYSAELDAEIARLGVSQCIVRLGSLAPEQLREQLAEAAVFVLPSLQENAPMAIGEAMAAGVPVVTSNVCGMPYMVTEGRTGYLVDPTDWQGLADRIERLLSDDRHRQDCGKAAREAARQMFHPANIAHRTLRLYHDIIADWASATPRFGATSLETDR